MAATVTADFGMGPESFAVVELLNAVVSFTNPQGIGQMTAIRYDGSLWLVPRWLESTDGQWRRPTTMLCLDSFEVQSISSTDPTLVHVLGEFAKAVLDGLATPPPTMKARSMPPVVALNPNAPVGAAG